MVMAAHINRGGVAVAESGADASCHEIAQIGQLSRRDVPPVQQHEQQGQG